MNSTVIKLIVMQAPKVTGDATGYTFAAGGNTVPSCHCRGASIRI
jgi:hypothetical protein